MKRYSDSTLMRMTKAELIEQLRCAEHNQVVAEEQLAQQAENVKDWVLVVHCKDCKYVLRAKWNKKGYRICPASHMEITDDDFCSYGEPR